MTIRYRPYDAALHGADVDALFDVDEYFPDIARVLETLRSPTIFLTGWLIMPSIQLKANLTLKALLIRELQKAGSRVFILWNTNYNGLPYPNLASTARNLHREVSKSAGAEGDRLKILLSTNREFDVPEVFWGAEDLAMGGYFAFDRARHFLRRTDPDKDLPSGVREVLQQFWLQSFPSDPEQYKNLSAFTLGSHHQKTVTVLGRTADGKLQLHAWCGGIDIASGPAGYHRGVHHGGTWWHDAALRVRGENAIPILENFVERWNLDLEGFTDGDTLGHGVSSADTLQVSALSAGVERATAASGAVSSQRTMPLGGHDWPLGHSRVTEVLEAYEEWIPRATKQLVIVNQYFRHQRIAELVAEQLDDEPELRVTLVMPMYTEEMGKRDDLVKLRTRYAQQGATADERAALLSKIREAALTIDPMNKLTLYAQSRCLERLIAHDRVRVWMPRPPLGIPYIHAKMLLVDTQALMIGSANINGRSLMGLADSEINLLLTEAAEVTRIRDRQGWHLEPEGQWAQGYTTTWFGRHNLVRYTKEHWDVDKEYGTFPKGRDRIFQYFDTVKLDGRADLPKTKFDRGTFQSVLDLLVVRTMTPAENLDLGQLLLEHAEHLI